MSTTTGFWWKYQGLDISSESRPFSTAYEAQLWLAEYRPALKGKATLHMVTRVVAEADVPYLWCPQCGAPVNLDLPDEARTFKSAAKGYHSACDRSPLAWWNYLTALGLPVPDAQSARTMLGFAREDVKWSTGAEADDYRRLVRYLETWLSERGLSE